MANDRALFDFLSYFLPLQSEYHIRGAFKEALAPLPTHATFAVLEPYKLLFHFPAAVWTAFATGFLRLGGGGNTLGSFLGAV